MAETLLHELPWAKVLAGNNELKIRAKTVAEGGADAADAVAIRFQVPVENLAGSGWIGAIFADIIQGSSADGPTERVQLKLGLKLDPGPVLELYATKTGGSNDSDEIRIFRFGLDGAEFGVPLKGVTGGGGMPSAFRSDDNRYLYNVQGDPTPEYPYGRIVQYRVDTMQPVAILKPEPL